MKKKLITFTLASAMVISSIGIMASAADKNKDSLEYASFETVSNEELSHIKDMPLEEPMAINDNEEDSVVNIEDLACDALDPDKITTAPVTSLARATERIEWDISAGATSQRAEAYSLEAGETVTINCSYTPMNASVDFGLITPDGHFRHANRTNGSINKEIKIYTRGKYRLAIRNNSNKTVSVFGYVNY